MIELWSGIALEDENRRRLLYRSPYSGDIHAPEGNTVNPYWCFSQVLRDSRHESRLRYYPRRGEGWDRD